jgi:hypothetical protein
MKLNLGSGRKRPKGFVNIDNIASCEPDYLMDLEKTPWDLPSDCADEILLNHVLEHLGAESSTFLAIMQELYRVSQNGCSIQINVPHPLHCDFRTDPTHVRAITPETLAMFSKEVCDFWALIEASNTPLAHICNVDFELKHINYIPDPSALEKYKAKGLIHDNDPIHEYAELLPGLIRELRMTLITRKQTS